MVYVTRITSALILLVDLKLEGEVSALKARSRKLHGAGTIMWTFVWLLLHIKLFFPFKFDLKSNWK